MDVPIGDYPFWKLGYIIGPKYGQAEKEFKYIYSALRLLGATDTPLVSMPNNGQWNLRTFLGQQVTTLSASDGEKVLTGTGESPDWILLVECGKMSLDIYHAARGRVARVRGKLTLSGTIEESERWYPELINRWQADNPEGARSFIVPTWDNRIVYPLGREDPEIKGLEATYTPDKFKERFGAVPVPLSTLVFKEFSHIEHIKPAPYWGTHDSTGTRIYTDEEHYRWRAKPVELAIDPGYAGAYAVEALQWEGDTVYNIDELYYQYEVVENVIDAAMQKEWWKLVTGGVIDIAGKQHQATDSQIEVWARRAILKSGSGIGLRANKVGIVQGIQRHRTFLINPFGGKPRLFHDPRCKGAIREYGLYQYRAVEEDRPISEEPIDANNHAMKAFCYWLFDRFGPTDDTYRQLKRKRYNKMQLGSKLARVFG